MVPRVLKLETDIHGMDRPISVLNCLHRLHHLHRLDAALLEGGPLEESLEGLGGWLGHDTGAALIISISASHMGWMWKTRCI
jgi:hypothetical protein